MFSSHKNNIIKNCNKKKQHPQCCRYCHHTPFPMPLHLTERPYTELINRKVSASSPHPSFNTYFIKRPFYYYNKTFILFLYNMYYFTNISIHTAFSSTAADPLLLFRMTTNGNHMLQLLTHSSQLIADSSQLIAFIFLPLSLITVIDPSLPFRMTPYRIPHHSNRFFAGARIIK